MWIAKDLLTRYIEERVAAMERARVLEDQNVKLNSTMDWFRYRLTQLEFERAQLIKRYMGIDVPVPEVAPVRRNFDSVEDIIRRGGEIFSDVGDKEAARLGVDWTPAGELKE